MSRKVQSPTQETGPSRLLHNIGGPARAAIVWNGYGRARADGRVTAIDGADIKLDAQSICVHGDTPSAVVIARTLRDALVGYGVSVKPFVHG